MVVDQPPAPATLAPLPTHSEVTSALPEKRTPAELPCEGGVRAWLAINGSFFIHCFAFAPTEYIFGIFEHHYRYIFPDATASSIAFVGTTGSAVTYLAGFLAGVVADRFGFRVTALSGTALMTVSLVLASFAKQVSQLFFRASATCVKNTVANNAFIVSMDD